MSFVSSILSKFLDQYIEKVDKSQVNVSLIKGHAELRDISFTPNLFSSFGVPLTIKDSRVGQIIIDFPSMNNSNETAYFKAINVDLYAIPDWSALNKVPINSVADLIQSMEDEKKATKADKRKVWDGWFEKVIDSATIDIRNVRLHVEFTNWDKTTSAITLFFDSLKMNTVDSDGNVIILTDKPEVLTKRIMLSSFSIAEYQNVEPFENFEKLNNIEYNFLNQNSFTFTMVHDRRKDSSFFNTFNLVIDPILFDLSQQQYFAFQHLIGELSKSRIRQKFQSCMRPLSEKMNEKYYIKMWSYLHRCAIKIRRPVEFRPDIALNFLKKRKDYSQSFMRSINKKQFVKKSIKKNGDDLTYLLIQYSAILMRRKERMIKLDKKDFATITSEDLRFFSDDSFRFNLTVQGICLKIPSFVMISVNNINFVLEKKSENIKVNLEVKDWMIDDINKGYQVVQIKENSNNFIMFKLDSLDNPAILEISKLKVDFRSSFLKLLSTFFVNEEKNHIKLTKQESSALNSSIINESSIINIVQLNEDTTTTDDTSIMDAEEDSDNDEDDEDEDEDDEDINNQKVKSSSINQILIKLNPKTLMKFNIILNGFLVTYTTDNESSQHLITSEIEQIKLKNYSQKSTETILNIKSEMLFGSIKVDDAVISEGFSLKTSTLGVIDEYYFLGDLVTKLDVDNAKIDVNSNIVDKVSNVLASFKDNTQSGSTKTYSDHKIYANCSNISVIIDTGMNSLVLSIAGMNMNPSVELTDITILDHNNPQITIPSLCFNKWPIIETDLLKINLNSYEFFNFLDEVNLISKQMTQLTNALTAGKSEIENETDIETKTNDPKEQINVIAHSIDYQMGDQANSMKLNDVNIILSEEFILKIGSLGLYDSENKQFLFCDNEINMSMNSNKVKTAISVIIPCLNMNFIWKNVNDMINYFHDSRDKIQQTNNETDSSKNELTKVESTESVKNHELIITIQNDNASIKIDDTYTLLIDKLKVEYSASDRSKLSLDFVKVDIDNLLEVNNFNFQIDSGYIFNINASSVNANLSEAKAAKIFNLSVINGVVELAKKYRSKKNKDFVVNIKDFTFSESSTDLHLIIPVVKFTLNSTHSIGALHIPSIKLERLVLDNIKLFLLFDSIDYNTDDIESIFALDRASEPKQTKLKLTSLILNINSIDFDYAHYFVMRIFNSSKIYSKFILKTDKKEEKNNDNSNDSELKISGTIDQINIRENNLSDSISLFALTFEKRKEATEFKCKSINCIELVKVKDDKDNPNFFVIQQTNSKTNIKLSPLDVFLNINTMKTLTNINESLSSLIKTDFDEKLNQSQGKDEKVTNNKKGNVPSTSLNIECNEIQVHFPFEDDPLFEKHDLIISFKLSSDILTNSYKSFSLTGLKMFFTNYQKQMKFLPLFSNGSFLIKIHDNNTDTENYDFSLIEIETGNFNVNISVLDIFELQMIINNFRKSFTSLLNPKTYSIPIQETNKKKLMLTAMNTTILVKPMKFSLCEENRASLIFNPIFTLNIEAKSATLNLQNQAQSFSIDLIFSIYHMNLLVGKFETFMAPTDLLISYSNGDSNTAYFGLSIKSAIDFNITPHSFRSIMKFIEKFDNKEQILLLKNESKFNYKPEYWVKNNLNSAILVKYHKQEEYRKAESELYVNPLDNLPMCEFHKDSLVTFQYKSIQGSFSPKNLIFPIFFKTISVSTVSHENYSQSIVFNSPLSIQNKLDCKVLIYIKTEKDYAKFTELLPKGKYPLHFEENEYIVFSDFESIIKDKTKRTFIQKKKPEKTKFKFDSQNLPQSFAMSLHKVPKVISIQDVKTKKSIYFTIKINNDPRSNTRVYEIVPSFSVKNLLPCPIFTQLYNRDNTKINEDTIILQSQDEKQINSINYDTQAIQICLSFDITQFPKPIMIKLDDFNNIFACNNSVAIQIRKKFKSDQKEIVIFTPCAIFNNTEETIFFSPSESKSEGKKVLPFNFAFYGLESYSDNDKSMKIDISVNNSLKKLKAIDCLRLNANCTTINLPRSDNYRLFYPINCSITLGKYPMNDTHVITFTPYLYVVNNLPFDFTLVPITSNKIESIDKYYHSIDKLHQSIEDEARNMILDSFQIPRVSGNDEKGVPIKWISKDGMFLFSSSKYANNPIIQLNRITRTVFIVKNRKERFYIELNIYEDKSTLYAHFQVPSYPVPLVINNSLDTPILVYQNIKPCQNKLLVEANTSSLFAFDEPFINSKQLYIEIHSKNKKDNTGLSYIPYLFSMEEQLSPLISNEDNFIISTTIISTNNSKMIRVRNRDDIVSYQNSLRGFLSIDSFHISLSQNKMNEIALFSMKNILAELCQDTKNSYITFSIESIQLDNQNPEAKIPVCLIGTGKNLLNKDEKMDKFVKFYSIFPRGVPFFSVINYMSIQIQPIFIIPESNLIANIISFFTSVFKNKTNNNDNMMMIEPSFNSVTVNKTMIAYFELNPISFVVNIPNEGGNDRDNIANVMRYMNMFSLNRFAISVPKLFVSEFNDNISYLIELFRDFYGNEIMKQFTKNVVVKMVTSSLIRFKKLHFIPLSSNHNHNVNTNLCDNRKQIFGYFNQIELNDVAKQSQFYFNQTPDVISLILDHHITKKELSNVLIYHPKSDKSNQKPNKNNNELSSKDRLVIGIQNDSNGSNVNNADLIKIFKANDIERIRMHPISPIYSCLGNSDKADQYHLKIQTEILKDKKLQGQITKFIVHSNSNNLIFCVTNEYVLIFEIKNTDFKLSNKIKLNKFDSVSTSGSVVSLKSNDPKIGQIDFTLTKEENAKLLESFINTQKTVISIFGRDISLM